jgi:hypothetical protein
MEMSKAGVRTIYPRAIYMTGHKAGEGRVIADPSRYEALAHLRTPDGEPAILRDHEYITIWGYWNGPDEALAAHDGRYYRAVNAEEACGLQLISADLLAELLERAGQRLARSGFEDHHLKPDHLLISFGADNQIVKDTMGKPEVRLCNFELVRRSRPGDGGAKPTDQVAHGST